MAIKGNGIPLIAPARSIAVRAGSNGLFAFALKPFSGGLNEAGIAAAVERFGAAC